MDVRGKVVLITGASRGIGAACAESFGRRGALLALVARTEIARTDAFTIQADLTDHDACSAAISKTLEHYGRIDILVNNAGFGMYGRTEDIPITDLDRMFSLNLRVPVHLIQLVLPHMRAQGSGMIVNVSSIAGVIALPWMTAYSASKAALSCFSDGFRRELHGTGIHVMDVLPGYIKTDFQSSAVGQPPPGVLTARKRAITAEQCAELIVRGVERDARTIAAPRWAWLLVWAQRLAPWAVDSPPGENEPMILKLKQTPGIFLTGFMASGKTTVGRLLAERIGWQFADLDRDIETAEQTTISEIFERHGEPEFRRIETEALQWRVKRIRAGGATVVALGGGTFTLELNREMVNQHGVSIWLDCPFDVVERRVALENHRPLALDPDHFRRLFDERHACYSQASYRVPVLDDDPLHVVEQIFALPIFAR